MVVLYMEIIGIFSIGPITSSASGGRQNHFNQMKNTNEEQWQVNPDECDTHTRIV